MTAPLGEGVPQLAAGGKAEQAKHLRDGETAAFFWPLGWGQRAWLAGVSGMEKLVPSMTLTWCPHQSQAEAARR